MVLLLLLVGTSIGVLTRLSVVARPAFRWHRSGSWDWGSDELILAGEDDTSSRLLLVLRSLTLWLTWWFGDGAAVEVLNGAEWRLEVVEWRDILNGRVEVGTAHALVAEVVRVVRESGCGMGSESLVEPGWWLHKEVGLREAGRTRVAESQLRVDGGIVLVVAGIEICDGVQSSCVLVPALVREGRGCSSGGHGADER